MYTVGKRKKRTFSSLRRSPIVLLHRLQLGPTQNSVNIVGFESPECCALTPQRRWSSTVPQTLTMPSPPNVSSTPSDHYSAIDAAYKQLPWATSSGFLLSLVSTPMSEPSASSFEDVFPEPETDISSSTFVETLSQYQAIRRKRLQREFLVQQQQSSADFDRGSHEDVDLYDHSYAAINELNETLSRVPFLPVDVLSILISLQKHQKVRSILHGTSSEMLECSFRECDFSCYSEDLVEKFQALFRHYKLVHDLVPVEVQLICCTCNEFVPLPLELHECLYETN